jgi:S-layer homology domain
MKKYFFVALVSAFFASGLTVFASGLPDPFTDVPEDSIYYDAVLKMRMMGVLTGYEDGTFGPEDPVTRGQMALILDRYDEALLIDPGNTWNFVSGVQRLADVVCDLARDFDFETSYDQELYTEICIGG